MKNKGTWIALGVFGVLLAVVLLTREKKVAVGVQRLEVPTFTQADVIQVEIKGNQNTKLWKDNGVWKVSDGTGAGHTADTPRVEALTQALATTRGDELVTDREERHSDLEVDEIKAVKLTVTLATKKKPFELWMGRSAQAGGSYVRNPGKKQVFISKGGLGWQVRNDANSWRKRSVLPVDPELVTAITVTQANATGAWDDTYTLEKKDNAWVLAEGTQVPAGFKLDPSLADDVAQQIKTLSAQDFAAVNDISVAPNVTTVSVKLTGGKNVVLQLGPEPNGQSTAWATELRNHLSEIDGAGNKDEKLQREELQAVMTNAKTSPELRNTARSALEAFDRAELGAFNPASKDGALTLADLDAYIRTASLTPVRVEGQDEAYWVAVPATSIVRKRASDLRDNALLSFDPAKAKKLTIVANGKTTVVSKDGETWKLLEPKSAPAGMEFDPHQVDAQLALLSRLKAHRALTGQKLADAQTGLAKPSVSLAVTLDGAPEQKLVLGADAKTEANQPIYARGAVDTELYLISSAEKTRLAQGVSLFKKPPPPPSAPGIPGLDQLPPDIRAKLEAQLRQQGGMPNR